MTESAYLLNEALLFQILRNLNIKIEPGETVALVGSSGNGKSTCLHLLERFYDPSKGEVLLDGYNLKSLNIHSLRSCIAVVGQEPVLFSTTIAENIRYGNPCATEQDIIEAAKNSGAHDFISELPDGYDTLISNSRLSGGQKQRIAIARALVQNPKVRYTPIYIKIIEFLIMNHFHLGIAA